MASENERPWYKDPRYLAIIVTIVGIIISSPIWLHIFQPADFGISVDPMQGAVHQGGVITTAITIEAIHGYARTVRLGATGQPSGVVVTFAPQSEPTPYTSTVTIKVNPSVPVGVYEITIEGTGADGKKHSCEYTLTVEIPTPIPSPTSSPTPNKVYLVPEHSNASFCNTVEVQIWANTTDTFGSGQINLTYSHCCANVTNLEYDSLWQGRQGTWDSSIDGLEWLVFIRPLGQPTVNGTVPIGNLTIHCCNENECVTSLTFSSPSKLSDPGDLTVTWIDGTFGCIRQVCGDVNCDGKVDVSDRAKLQYYVEFPGDPKYTICSKWAADVNCDHSINESDLEKLQYYVGFPEDSRYTLNCCE